MLRDPLLEKGVEKFNKEQQTEDKESGMWWQIFSIVRICVGKEFYVLSQTTLLMILCAGG